jgi:hypothetical protein
MSQLQILEKDVEIPASFFEGADIQVATAKKYPRDVKKCLEEAEFMALMSEDIAASCFYTVPRAGKNIQGPSVRLAEIFISAWGNIYMASEIKENNGRSITARAYCWDVEKNIRAGVEVKRSILTKEGKIFSTDMQNVTENSACSIALRNAIFKVIPRGYIDSLLERCQKKSMGNGKANEKFVEKRKEVFERLKALGIEESRIFSFFKKEKIEDFDMTDVTNLIGVGTAIKEGHLKVEEAFQIEPTRSDFLAEEILAKGRATAEGIQEAA